MFRVILPQSDRIWGLEEVFQVFVAWWTSAGPAGWSCIQVQSHASATRTVNLWLLLTSLLSHTSHPPIITLYSCAPANQRTEIHSCGDAAIIPETWPLYHYTHSREGKDAGAPWERVSKGDRKCCWMMSLAATHLDTCSLELRRFYWRGFGIPASHLLLN